MFTEIILGIVIIIIIYLLYTYFFTSATETDLSKGGDAKTLRPIKNSRLPSKRNSSTYSYSVWLYVDDWNYRYDQQKRVFVDVNPNKGAVNPQVTLGPQMNTINVSISIHGRDDPQTCVMNNVPLQKWTNLIVVLNNRALDLYLDGKLVRTCILEGVPYTGGSIYLTPDGGFSGETSSFRYFSQPLNPRQAYEIYREGPSGSLFGNFFNKYRIKLAFMKGNSEVGSLEI